MTLLSASRLLGEFNGLYISLTDPKMFITIALQESRDSSAIEIIITTKDEPLLTTNGIKKAVQLKYEI